MRALAAGFAVFSMIVPSLARAADATPEDPLRFYDPEEWDVQVTVSCEGSNSVADGFVSATYTAKSGGQAHAHVTTLTAVDFAHIRALRGAVHGDFKVDDKDVQVAGGKVTTTIASKGSGNGGPQAYVSLSITSQHYEVKLENTDIPVRTTVVVSPPGSESTEDGSRPLDFVSDEHPFPDHGMELKGQITLPDNDGCAAPGTPTQPVYVQKIASWVATPVKKMEAKPKLVAAFHRGEPAQLDGSDSTGHPTKFEWELTPKPCPKVSVASISFGGKQAPGGKKHEGKTWNVKLLCDTVVELKVTDDDGNTDSEKITVSPTKRDDFNTTMDKDAAPGTLDEPFANGAQSCGKNRCKEDSDGKHWIHTSTSDRSDNVAFDQLNDPASPFDQWAYVTGVTLKIERQPFINERLLPGGIVAAENPGPAALLVKQIKQHEKAHSDIVRDKLHELDPGPDVEQLCDANSDNLLKEAETVIDLRDGQMASESSESAVSERMVGWKGKSVSLRIPDSDGQGRCTWTSGDLSVLGEGRNTKLTDCSAK